MKLALRELLRRPKAFFVPAGTLLLLSLLLLYPTAVLDGLYDSSTSALRTVDGQLVVFSHDSYRSLFRSRIEADERARVSAVPGIESANGFSAILLSGELFDAASSDPIGLAVIGSETIPGGVELKENEAIADQSLEAFGVKTGSIIEVGPFKVKVRVAGMTKDSSLLLQGGLIMRPGDWHDLLTKGSSAALKEDVSQALIVKVKPGADPVAVATAIDDATSHHTETLTVAAAVRALPGIEQQDATFGYIRFVTFGVALVVVGLFLSFVTLERTPLYAALKAIGASSRQLFSGVLAQVLCITAVAVAMAVLATLALSKFVPLGLPTSVHPNRVVETAVGLAFTAVLGSALSLRRVMRIDPASAIS